MFLPVGDKSKNTSIGKGGETGKGMPKKEKVGVSPSDDDTDPHGNDKMRGENVEDEKIDDEDLPPDDDTELHRNEQTKGNAVEDKSDHEESPKTDKMAENLSLHSITENERKKYNAAFRAGNS